MMYLRLGALVAFLAVAALALWYRGNAINAEAERDKAIASLAIATEANAEQQKAIAALQEQARFDSRLTASLVEEMRKINDTLSANTAALTDLENANEDVRKFLDAAVPPDLCKLYDRC